MLACKAHHMSDGSSSEGMRNEVKLTLTVNQNLISSQEEMPGSGNGIIHRRQLSDRYTLLIRCLLPQKN